VGLEYHSETEHMSLLLVTQASNDAPMWDITQIQPSKCWILVGVLGTFIVFLMHVRAPDTGHMLVWSVMNVTTLIYHLVLFCMQQSKWPYSTVVNWMVLECHISPYVSGNSYPRGNFHDRMEGWKLAVSWQLLV
jgi:hypothetical protein